MKNITKQTANQHTEFNKNKPSPEIRDNLDSRKAEEQESKGDDITHNRKEQHGEQEKTKK